MNGARSSAEKQT